MAGAARNSDTGVVMSTKPFIPADPQGRTQSATERRQTERARPEVWPEAMRDEFRKVEFLAAVEVEEADAAAWREVFAAFERRGGKYL